MKQKLLVAMRLLRLVVVGLAVALLAGVEVAEAGHRGPGRARGRFLENANPIAQEAIASLG